MLVFNGTRFLQVIEGSEVAIAELLERLRRDPRHTGLEVRDERQIAERSFPDWSMELVRVSAGYFEARDTIRDRVPGALDGVVREQIFRLTEGISGTVAY